MAERTGVLSVAVLMLSLLSSCVSFLSPMETMPAQHGPRTQFSPEFRSLPEPTEKVVAAVYKFRDQTGQYKLTNTGSTFSTAVTQGATSILIQILEESGWFIPIEREGLSNLLNERKIIRSSRAEYLNRQEDADENMALLPPLLFAGILIEGGIISYETNLLTGGVGVKYFGVGGSEEYRLDRITIYLRAVSSQNGRILKTVHTSKTILSQSTSAGIYRFIDYQRLLEAEAGFSYNEPPEICIREAMEKAVQALVIEGLFDNLWTLKNASAMEGPVIQRYLADKRRSKEYDPAGLRTAPFEQIRVSGGIGAQELRIDYIDNEYERPLYVEAELHPARSSYAISCRVGYYVREVEPFFRDNVIAVAGFLKYYLLGERIFQPYLAGGLEYQSISGDYSAAGLPEAETSLLSVPIRVGLRYRMLPVADLFMEAEMAMGLGDRMDRLVAGRWNDYVLGITAGVGIAIP